MNTYTQGDLVELPAEFRDADTGALTDPDTLALRVVAPDGTESTYAYPGANITRSSTGTFAGTVDTTPAAGGYEYEWVLTGSVQGVEPGSFYVDTALPDAAAFRRVRARLARMVAATKEPTLDDAALDDLLAGARRPDSADVLPSEDGWVPTYDLDAAAAAGWELKAGLCAADYNFSAAGKTFNRAQVHEMCLAMAKRYRRGRGSATASSGAVDAMVEIRAAEGWL